MKYVAKYFDKNGIKKYIESDYISTLKYNARKDGAKEIKISEKKRLWKTYSLK